MDHRIGKTSIAAIAGSTQYKFRQLNAVTNTKKDMQLVVEEAKMSGQVILFTRRNSSFR